MKQFYIVLLVALVRISTHGQSVSPRERPTPPPETKTIVAGTGAYTEDPQKVLHAAAEAIKAVRSLSYNATYESTGAMSTRSPLASGKVSLARLESGNPLKAMMAASGAFIASGTDEKVPFSISFDGEMIRKVLVKSRSVGTKTLSSDNPRERTLGTVTGYFGGGAYSLLLLDYLSDEPLRKEADATLADYEGRAAVAGSLCHVVYVEYPDRSSGKVRRERLFVGVKDNLLRRIETITADNDGRFGMYVLTISDLTVNPVFSKGTFSVATPKGFAVKPFPETAPPTLLNVGEQAPELQLLDPSGAEHRLADYKGKVLILDFWATWCGPCIKAMPSLQNLHEKFKDRGVAVIGVNAWEESNSVEYMKRLGYSYGLLLKGERISEAYHIPSLPTLYVIDTQGKIAYAGKGLEENLEPLIEKLVRNQ
nr:thiol:disulfide oxidoreductase [uncultured bacterium]